LFWALPFLLSFYARPSPVPLGAYQKLNEFIVAQFNKNELGKVYASGSAHYTGQVERGYFNYRWEAIKAKTGAIKSYSLAEDLGPVKYFEWVGEWATARFELTALSATKFSEVHLTVIEHSKNPPVLTDNPLKTAVDSLVQQAVVHFMRGPNRTGLSVGVLCAGRRQVYNYRAASDPLEPLPTGNTIYEIGSVTKTFTGILLAQAVLDKKVTLNDDVRLYLNEPYPNLAYQGQPIRLVHLANQSSGLPLQLPTFAPDRPLAYNVGLDQAYTPRQLLIDLREVRLDTFPGAQASYSNAAFRVLGLVLERVYQLSYEELVSKYITAPAGMRSTGVQLTVAEQRRFAKPYAPDGQASQYALMGMPAPGGLRSTANDLLRYVQYNVAANQAPTLSQQPTITSSAGELGWAGKCSDYHRRMAKYRTGAAPRALARSVCYFRRKKRGSSA
jgi:CubicO group peptidase (beta-lactamase class C family)